MGFVLAKYISVPDHAFTWSFYRVIFRNRENEFAHLVQGGASVSFVKSQEDQNSRKMER